MTLSSWYQVVAQTEICPFHEDLAVAQRHAKQIFFQELRHSARVRVFLEHVAKPWLPRNTIVVNVTAIVGYSVF